MAQLKDHSIWGFAFGYFAAYVPYSALTKAASSGAFGEPVSGAMLLPVSTLASLVGMMLFLSAMRWWRHAHQLQLGPLRLPRPTRWTLLSGLCTSAVIATTTLAYTFDGISIVFMMLLMRGGVLVLAPLVDSMTGRRIRWFSVVGLILGLDALLIPFLEESDGGFGLSAAALLDLGVYLLAYFVRLRFMSRLAKSDDANTRTRYFVEEQMVATPALLLFLAVLATIDATPFMHQLREGFTHMFHSEVLWVAVLIGLCSQGTGVFGGLVLLDKRENSFSVPVNRCASVLAGVAASFVLVAWRGAEAPSWHELVGVLLIVQALLFLSLPAVLEARRRGA